MKAIQKWLKSAKKEGIKIDTELMIGLKGMQKQIDIVAEFKKKTGRSPSRVWQRMHRAGTN